MEDAVSQSGDGVAVGIGIAAGDFNPGIGTGTIGDQLIFPAGDAGVVGIDPEQRDLGVTSGASEAGRCSRRDAAIDQRSGSTIGAADGAADRMHHNCVR